MLFFLFLSPVASTNFDYYSRAHEDPKPLVVGIAWVVECVEKRQRLDESKYLVDLDQNVAGIIKVIHTYSRLLER